MPEDAATPRRVAEAEPFTPDGKLTFSKLDAVFKSGNATRDTIPSHLLVGPGRQRGGRRVLLPRVPGGRLRAGGRRAPGECAELHRLQGDRRARPALDPARGRQRAQVPLDVVRLRCSALAAPRAGDTRCTSKSTTVFASCGLCVSSVSSHTRTQPYILRWGDLRPELSAGGGWCSMSAVDRRGSSIAV